jgi:lysozyme family protein
MSTVKDKFINRVIDLEGGYVNNPDDSGGETNFGITQQVARNYGYSGDMRVMPRTLAYRIYADLYWNSLKLDDVLPLSEKLAEEMVDTGINMGVGRAGKFLQTCLNALNLRGELYDDLKVDGGVGPVTLKALSEFLNWRGQDGETVLLRAMNALQGAYYIELSQNRQKDETFVYGWLLNRVA